MRYCAIEYALPSKVVTNTEIIQEIISRSARCLTQKALDLLACRLDELFKRSVTDVRYHRAKNERAIQFGIEAGRKAVSGQPLVKPDFRVVYLSPAGVAVDAHGFAKNDINPSPVRFPAKLGNASPELTIGIADAAVMLFLEFIFWRS